MRVWVKVVRVEVRVELGVEVVVMVVKVVKVKYGKELTLRENEWARSNFMKVNRGGK